MMRLIDVYVKKKFGLAKSPMRVVDANPIDLIIDKILALCYYITN